MEKKTTSNIWIPEPNSIYLTSNNPDGVLQQEAFFF